MSTLLLCWLSVAARDVAGRSAILKGGAVYCATTAALTEHATATERGDIDRVRAILLTRHACDYTQTPVTVVVVEDLDTSAWLKVRVTATTEAWRKGSKMALPPDGTIVIKRNGLK